MPMNQHPYHVTQAVDLIQSGKCQLPVDWSDVAARLARHPNIGRALQNSYNGDHRMLRLMTETTAMALCKDFDQEAAQ